jgi:predicted Zn-dependent peptidase
MTQTEEMKVTKLNNGLRVILVPINGVRSVTVMKGYNVGSRYETKEMNGAAHFVEHLMFKGGKKYTETKQISNALDKIGAEYNAFTSKDITMYYAKVPSAHFELACDIISDMTYEATFDTAAVERGVIFEEMKSYEDSPGSHVGDVFESISYGDTPTGRNIGGTDNTINGMTRDQLFAFKQKYYTDSNSALIVVGALPNNVEDVLNKYFNGENGTVPESYEKAPDFISGSVNVAERDIEQTHFNFGFPCEGHLSSKKSAYDIICRILGGGMGSRLFDEVREKRGLCYGISMGSQLLEDTGFLAVSSSVNGGKFEEALDTVKDVIAKFAAGEVTEEELAEAKSGIAGRVDLSLENTISHAMALLKNYVITGTIITPAERIRRLNSVTLQQLKDVAKEVFNMDNANLAVIKSNKITKE